MTCKYIGQYAFNVREVGEEPHGYDGMAECLLYDENIEDNDNNRDIIEILSPACNKYEKCTERQADYLDIYDPETKSIIPNPNPLKNKEGD